MFSKLKKSQSEGFTIIEVMIVLAIAALILLIVFLAIPALQRTSRNTQRKSGVASLTGNLNNAITDAGGGNVTAAMVATAASNTQFGYTPYTGHVYFNLQAVVPAGIVAASTVPAANVVTTEDVNIYQGRTCTSANAVPVAGNGRQFAVVYGVENAAGNGTLECQTS
jgi:prepilin-type N-terminal cleavage/methylation domain-containing protein